MNATVDDLMAKTVLCARPGDTIGTLRDRMKRRSVHCFPVINSADEPLGIVTVNDLVDAPDDDTPLSGIMHRQVLTVARSDSAAAAARLMRDHHIHHLIVTDEKKVVGVLSSFDLLRLVEDHGS